MIPGMNVFNMAMSAIAPQEVLYRKFTGRTNNAKGLDIATYAAAVTITGSMQAVDRAKYQNLGLDFTKNYKTFYTSNDIQDVQRDTSGDLIKWNNKVYQVIGEADWFDVDGWTGVLCVQITDFPDF